MMQVNIMMLLLLVLVIMKVMWVLGLGRSILQCYLTSLLRHGHRGASKEPKRR